MAFIPIAMPRIIAGQLSGNSPIMMKPGVEESGTAANAAWLKSSLVQITGTGASVVLQTAASAATLLYGLAPQAGNNAVSSGPTVQPPLQLQGVGANGRLKHFPQDLRGVILEMNITNGSASGANIGAGTGVTFAGGGTGGVPLAPGLQFGLLTMTSGTYNKYQTIDVTNTAQKLFEIIQLAPGLFNGAVQTTADNNPRVWVKLIDSVLQG